ncbi:MAG: hypothetical protein JWM89_1519 [Acidimicrobiales bacterium]|nr:hypothetical protein [Acidimicrobiales bacterium]
MTDQPENGINPRLTPTSTKPRSRRSKRRYTETVDYLTMVARMIRAAGTRVGSADMEELRMLRDLHDEVDQALAIAIPEVRSNGGYSWRAIGEAFGISAQAAQQRWGQNR